MDDPTIRRCIGFAKGLGYRKLYVCNIFAYRSTDPRKLYGDSDDIVGPDNDKYLRRLVETCDTIIAAWGTHGALLDRGNAVRAMLAPFGKLWHLGLTKDGHPKHPLYLKADTQPVSWE